MTYQTKQSTDLQRRATQWTLGYLSTSGEMPRKQLTRALAAWTAKNSSLTADDAAYFAFQCVTDGVLNGCLTKHNPGPRATISLSTSHALTES